MHSVALRALATAALAVGQSSLTVTSNGTYLAVVELDSVPVTLLVDTFSTGLWVKCSAVDTKTCADGITTKSPTYTKKKFDRVDRNVATKTKRFTEVKIAGQTFNAFDATVVYDPLAELDSSIQGVLGLKWRTDTMETSPMYFDDQVKTVALQLGLTSSDSKLSLDTIDEAMLAKKGATTKVDMNQKISCFQIPLVNGSLPTGACSSTENTAFFEPASPRIGLTSTLLYTLERRFLYTCTKVRYDSLHTDHFLCSERVKLPRLTLSMGSWDFYLDPEDYTTPTTSNATLSTAVTVLIGDQEYMYFGLVLGAPFLRKFPVNLSMTTSRVSVYCAENSTCTKNPTKPLGSMPISGGGTTGRGDDGAGDDDYKISVDLDGSKKKKKKLYLTIGLSVGGAVLLAILSICCKACFSKDDTTDEEDVAVTADNEGHKTDAASHQVVIPVGGLQDGDVAKPVVGSSAAGDNNYVRVRSPKADGIC